MSNTNNLDLSADLIDVRDIIARVEELEQGRDGYEADALDAWRENYPGDEEELGALTAILDDLKDSGGDEQWRGDWYPVTLIRDDYFEDYARELAEDIGAIVKHTQWPNNHIDWTAAAEALQQDYTSTDIEGTDYWYR